MRDAEYLAITVLQGDGLVTVYETLAGLADGVVSVARFDDLFSS